jgi:hypothetical protein
MAMFVAFTNMEMKEMYDEYEDAISKTKIELSPFKDIGRKLNTIFSDAFVSVCVLLIDYNVSKMLF